MARKKIVEQDYNTKRTIEDLKGIRGKVILLRVDFNVPIDDTGRILDTTRITRSLPTIKYLSRRGAKIVLLSHLDRPDGYDIRKSLWPIALILMRKLPCNVSFCHSVISEEAKDRIKKLKEGNVLLLENIRFYEGELSNDKKFAKELASLGDIFVDDAFGVAHRENASNYGVARLLPNAIGFLMEKEVSVLGKAIQNPKHPFVAVVGGAKVNTKIKILKKFIEKADTILIGGAMAYTFLYARGEDVGTSIVHEQSVEVAREILNLAESQGKKILLPIDHLVVRDTDRNKRPMYVDRMVGDMAGFDIGPKTIKLYCKEIAKAKQIFWNGPMGMFEVDAYKNGTLEIAKAIASAKGYTIVGGGDTVNALGDFGLESKVDYVSTGGGATFEFLERGSLPALDVIQEKIE